jgi:hypothetical protein
MTESATAGRQACAGHGRQPGDRTGDRTAAGTVRCAIFDSPGACNWRLVRAAASRWIATSGSARALLARDRRGARRG